MKYRKLPVVIDAEVYRSGLEDGFGCPCANCYKELMGNSKECHCCSWASPYIETLEGRMAISEGDFIITGVKSERYPCKPEIFWMTYEEAT